MRQRMIEAGMALVLMVALMLAVAPVLGQEQQGPPNGPGLMVTSGEKGNWEAAPVQRTTVEITVRGLVARARVTQNFVNPGDSWVEGIYIFPLPPKAAVDTLRMVVGERVLEGRLKERERAREVYARARREGRKATLVEQERPNVFTTSVANIGPGEEVEVELEMQWLLTWRADHYELRFPTVVGPRFIPGTPQPGHGSGIGWGPDTDEVPDASRITPQLAPAGAGLVNPFELTMDLDVGVRLEDVVSPSHRLRVRHGKGTAVDVSLAEPDWANRDLVVDLEPERGEEPSAVVLGESFQGDRYLLLMVVPPRMDPDPDRLLPREVIFVLDTSGSMYGTSIVQAKEALDLALARLRPRDRFNVIEFNSRTRSLWPESRPAVPSAVEAARRWVRRLDADGGTVMLPALEAALEPPIPEGMLRQVVFITDGCVGNDEVLLSRIERDLGDARLFTVGIGSAPNGSFMERAAEAGRGTATFVQDLAQVKQRMAGLFRQLETPVLKDLEVVWPDAGAEMWPRRLGDLYEGEPLVAVVRSGSDAGEAVISGVRADAPWEVRIPLEIGRPFGGIHRLWARRKIEALERSRRTGTDPDSVRREVVDVSLEHGVLSRYTALVAVDVTPDRPEDEALHRKGVPVNLPAGWSRRHVFGPLPQTGTSFRFELLLALLALALAAVVKGFGK